MKVVSALFSAAFLLCCQVTVVRADSFALPAEAGNACTGNYLNITAKGQNLAISELGLLLAQGRHQIQVYTKSESYVGSELVPDHWQLLLDEQIRSYSEANFTMIALREILVPADTMIGLMIVSNNTVFYSNADGTNEFQENQDLKVFSRDAACGEPFAATIANRVWNGKIVYNDDFCFQVKAVNDNSSFVCL